MPAAAAHNRKEYFFISCGLLFVSFHASLEAVHAKNGWMFMLPARNAFSVLKISRNAKKDMARTNAFVWPHPTLSRHVPKKYAGRALFPVKNRSFPGRMSRFIVSWAVYPHC
jgi:hypothetical protein